MLNLTQKDPVWKFAVYGPPGTGKTHLAVTMPDPVVFLSERHGFETLRTAAAMLGKPVPPTIWIRTLKQMRASMRILATNRIDPLVQMMRDSDVIPDSDLKESGITRDDLVRALPYVKPRSVSLDSVSELSEMFGALVDSQGGKESKDGLEYRKMNAWGPIEEKTSEFLRLGRDLPYHVLFICLMNERNHGSTESPDMRFEPLLLGKKLPKKLCSMVNAVGFMRITKERIGSGASAVVKLTRSVRFVAPDIYMQKCATPLRNDEAPNVEAWIEALSLGEAITGPMHAIANVSAGDEPEAGNDAGLGDVGSPE